MSRRFRTKRKKGTKLDQAFRMAKANRKAIKQDIEYANQDIVIASEVLSSTPVISHVPTNDGSGNKVLMKSF